MTFDCNYTLKTILPLAEAAYSPEGPLPEGWSLATTIRLRVPLRDSLGFCPPDPVGTPFGIIARHTSGVNAVSFRGTMTPVEWADDFTCGLRGNVESGFQEVYDAVSLSIPSLQGPTIITGHSLGAALAVLHAQHSYRPGDKVVTFAGPRVGNRAFQTGFNQKVPDCYRVVNVWDLVPRTPLEIQGFAHVGTSVEINGGPTNNWHDAHRLVTYRAGLQKFITRIMKGHLKLVQP